MEVERSNRKSTRSSSSSSEKQQKVCYHWKAGKCHRFPCPYLHPELPVADGAPSSNRHGRGFQRNRSFNNSWVRQPQPQPQHQGSGNRGDVKKTDKICNYWLQEKCKYGENCRFMHSWYKGDTFSMVTQLEGHEKVVTGIVLPAGSDKLYTGSKDESLRVWDCNSGQSVGVVTLGGEIGCMLSEGPWIFVGLTNLVRAWNIQTRNDLSLDGPVGRVYALVVGNDMLFAGGQNGTILAWKFDLATNRFETAASLKGHTRAVLTLVVGADRLYSGSMDHSIRMWSLEDFRCLQTLTEHTDVVMSVIRSDRFLLSCSLDKTVKIWADTERGNLEVIYTHNEEHGLLRLCGTHDEETKPVLFCSCNDNSIRIYDLPSFNERGKIFSKEGVQTIQVGPGGLFFTDDGTGVVRVWRWLKVNRNRRDRDRERAQARNSCKGKAKDDGLTPEEHCKIPYKVASS